mgnify:CR=1 FL=1
MYNYRLGGKIQGLRKSRGMTQKELADFLGYSESFISYVEGGERSMAVTDLQKIAQIFSVDVDFLLEKPKTAHFRADTNSQQNIKINYDEMMEDFLKYVDENPN